MKKNILFIALALVVVLAAVALVGCSESYKGNSLPTEKGEVADNGGMAVVYGKYLYFVNGYAGVSADNTYGNVVKGAICRIELENGLPKGEAKVVASKNVYGTDTTYGGIYVAGDYVYYASTNTDLDSTGSPKTSSGVLMRTKLDGSYTERITTFSDHSFVFTVVGNKLTYIRNNTIYAVDLNNGFATTTVESGLLSGYLVTEDYVYFTQYKDGDSSNYIVKAYPLAGGAVVSLIDNTKLTEGVLYTFSLLSAIDEGNNKVKLFYSKTDNGVNTPEVGIYAYEFDKASFAFDKSNEVRFTHNATSTTNLAYTKFYKAGPYYYGFASTKLDMFNADGTRVEEGSVNIGSSFTVSEIEEKDNAVYLWYLASNVLYRLQVMSEENGVYTPVEESTKKMFSASYDSTYLTFDRVGDVICYFNSSISNNAYYYVLDAEAEDTAAGKILGIITQADRIAAF